MPPQLPQERMLGALERGAQTFQKRCVLHRDSHDPIHVDGVERPLEGAQEMPRGWFYRNRLQWPGTGYGRGIGLCRVCTVYLDGPPRAMVCCR